MSLNMFDLCTLSNLDVSNNPLSQIDYLFFGQIQINNLLIPANELMCCMLADGHYNGTCSTAWEVSVCDDLLVHDGLSYLLWIVCLLCLIPNVVCLCRIYKQNNKFTLTVTNLVTAGLIIIPYLLILGVQHSVYKGMFYYEKLNWPSRIHCHIASVSSFISLQMSLTMVVVIAAQRALVTAFPFHAKIVCSKKVSHVTAIIAWSLWISLAFLPIITNYFGVWRMSVTNNICLCHDLRFTGPWKYVFIGVFLGINNTFLLLVTVCTFLTYWYVVKSSRNIQTAGKNLIKRQAQVRKKMIIVNISTTISYVPMIVISILTLLGTAPTNLVWGIIGLIILPISSIVNPIAYA